MTWTVEAMSGSVCVVVDELDTEAEALRRMEELAESGCWAMCYPTGTPDR